MTTAPAAKPYPAWLPLALDFVPLIIFFVTFKLSGVFVSTAVFMVAIVTAIIVAKIKIGRVSPMMWLSAILVVGFGGLTLYLHDQRFIQIKPTAIYLMLGGLLFAGLLRGKPLLKYVLEHGYTGLSERGWLLFSRNWAVFFFAMAGLNEVLRASVSFDLWLTVKVWGVTILSILFTAANMPMLMKHGLGAEDAGAKAESV